MGGLGRERALGSFRPRVPARASRTLWVREWFHAGAAYVRDALDRAQQASRQRDDRLVSALAFVPGRDALWLVFPTHRGRAVWLRDLRDRVRRGLYIRGMTRGCF